MSYLGLYLLKNLLAEIYKKAMLQAMLKKRLAYSDERKKKYIRKSPSTKNLSILIYSAFTARNDPRANAAGNKLI